jgi:hypothetical protein
MIDNWSYRKQSQVSLWHIFVYTDTSQASEALCGFAGPTSGGSPSLPAGAKICEICADEGPTDLTRDLLGRP